MFQIWITAHKKQAAVARQLASVKHFKSLSFAPISDTISESFWQWGESKFHKQRRLAMNTRNRVDENSMVETVAGIHKIQEAINAFYSNLVAKFADDESSVVTTVEKSLLQLKEMQLLDLKKRILGSFSAFQKAYITSIQKPLISARMAANRALRMTQQLNSLLASIRDEVNVSKIAPELEVIKASLYIADSRILAAFHSLENKTDPHVPDNMVENRYKRLERCLQNRDVISELTSKITHVVNQITQTVDLENDNCPLFKFPVSASSPALEAEDDQHALGCALAKSISHYLSALHVVQACITDYENLLNGWDSWLRKVETDLRKTRFSISISNSKMYHLERKSRYLEWIGNLRERYAAGEITIFDLQSDVCDVTANQMLQDTEYAIENIENEVVIPVQSHLSEISSLLAGHYVEGLKRLSLFYYYFEDPVMKEYFDTSARSLDIWRKPVFQRGHKSVSWSYGCVGGSHLHV